MVALRPRQAESPAEPSAQLTIGPFREDGYFNMTKAAKHFGKRLDNFLSSTDTRAYMDALSLAFRDKEIVEVRRGSGLLPHVGTYGHPKLAVFFARWLDVRFAVWCDMQIDDILHGRSVVVQAQQAPAVEPQQRICPAVHQKPATATTTP